MPIEIELNEKFKLGSDSSLNIVLYKKRVAGERSRTPGEETWNAIAWFSNLRTALLRFFELEVIQTDEDIKSIKELQDLVKRTEQTISIKSRLFDKEFYAHKYGQESPSE